MRRPPGSPHRGKTPVSALLSQAYARPGARVIAIDTDSNPNLGESLGLTLDATESMRQLPRSLIVGASGDVTVEDLLHEALADHADVTLVDMARASSTSAAPRDPAA